MLFRPDRRRRAADRTLPHRMALFATGAALALAGMLWQRSVLVLIAIVVLAIGVALSQLERRAHDADAADDPAGADDDAGSDAAAHRPPGTEGAPRGPGGRAGSA